MQTRKAILDFILLFLVFVWMVIIFTLVIDTNQDVTRVEHRLEDRVHVIYEQPEMPALYSPTSDVTVFADGTARYSSSGDYIWQFARWPGPTSLLVRRIVDPDRPECTRLIVYVKDPHVEIAYEYPPVGELP